MARASMLRAGELDTRAPFQLLRLKMAGILEARRIGLLPEDSMGRTGIRRGLAEKEHFDGGQFRRRCGELYAYQGYVDCAQCPDWEDTG